MNLYGIPFKYPVILHFECKRKKELKLTTQAFYSESLSSKSHLIRLENNFQQMALKRVRRFYSRKRPLSASTVFWPKYIGFCEQQSDELHFKQFW